MTEPSEPSAEPAAELAVRAARLVERLKGVTASWYEARTDGPAGERRPRRDHLRALVVALAELGREAGSGAPAGVVPHDVGVYALGDQVAVLAADLGDLGDLAPVVQERAAALVADCYAALWLTP